MTSLKAMGLLLLAMFIMVAESSSSSRRGGGNSHNYDLSDKADQTRLYNSKVYEAEKVSRPLDGWLSWTGARHSGVRVTVEDGSQYLIHKGKDYGISSQTVVVDADHMSSKWRVDDTKDFGGDKTVSDFVGAGGPDYSLLKKNCHDATDDMWRQD